MIHSTPRWLETLERKIGWLGIPNVSLLLITLQAFGFFAIHYDPVFYQNLVLVPGLVLQGEVWRLFTFLAVPLTMSFLWIIIALWFLYFILNILESQWGAFKTTFYVLVCVLLMIGFSFAFNYPITSIRHFHSTLFLAAAALFPEFRILLFFVLPVKMKWIAWLTLALITLEFVRVDPISKLILLGIYANYLLFFGPTHYGQIKNFIRRKKMKF